MTTETRRYWLARLLTCTDCGLVWGADSGVVVETACGPATIEPPADCPACAHRRVMAEQMNAYSAARELVERLKG